MGEVRGQKNFMFCIHIWIPHKVPSIVSTHTHGVKTKFYPPPYATFFSGGFGAKFGANLVQTSSTFWTYWGGV